MLRRLVSVTLALTIAGGMFAGCATQSGGAAVTPAPASQTETKTETKTEVAEGSAADIDTSKAVDVVWYHLGDVPKNDQLALAKAEWDKILKEKVNATLTIKFIEWADYLTKYNLMLASGEPFDMINTASDWLDMWPNAAKGAFMDITNMLPTYAPQTWAAVSQGDWDQCKYEGKIIAIPENQYTQWVNHGLYYRGDWATEFGINDPIMSWDGIEKYLDAVKASKTDIVPYDINKSKFLELSDGWIGSYTDSIMLEIPTNTFYSKSADDKYTVFSPLLDEALMTEMATMMKRWSDKGFWRSDVLNYDGDTRANLKAGLTALDGHHTQTFASLRFEMDEKQPGSELQMFPFHLQRGKNLTRMSITHGAQSVAASSKNPERALMVYDLIRNDEALYRLMNYGREGVQYVVKDGVRTRPDSYEETRDGFYTDFWGGRMDAFEIPSATTYAGITDVYAMYDNYAIPFPYPGFVFDKTPVDTEISTISDVRARNLTPIMAGKVSDPAAAVQTMIAELKTAGIEKVIAEIQKQIDAYKATQQ